MHFPRHDAIFVLMPPSASIKGRIVSPIQRRSRSKKTPARQSKSEQMRAKAYEVVAISRKKSKKGWVKLLMACPVKGVFEHLESPSTDTLWHS